MRGGTVCALGGRGGAGAGRSEGGSGCAIGYIRFQGKILTFEIFLLCVLGV